MSLRRLSKRLLPADANLLGGTMEFISNGKLNGPQVGRPP